MRRRVAATVALAGAAALAGTTLLAVSGWLLSRAAEHPPVLHLMVAIVAVRACGLARGVLRYVERLVGHDVALRRQQQLRRRAYEALAGGSWVGRRSGDLLARVVDDVAAVGETFVRSVVPLCSAALVVLAAGVALTVLEPAAGLVVLAVSLLGAVVVPLVTARAALAADLSRQGLRGSLAARVAEAGRAAPDVVAFGAAPVLLREVLEAERALHTAERRSALLAGLGAGLQLLTTGAATLAALVLGARAVEAGTLPPVELAVLALTPLALHELVGGVPPAVQAAARARGAGRRLAEVLGAAPGGGDVEAPRRGPGRVRLEDVTLGWPGGPDVVRHLDLRVDPGERVALAGPSGSGKSTVAAAVLGLLAPRAGTVEVEGRPGLLGQDAHLFDTTVGANVRLGRPGADRSQVVDALQAVRLALDPDRFVGEHGERVSGGEARRIALARLRLDELDVVVLDEPTEHLDAATAHALVEDLLRLTRGTALLVVTHDPGLLARCDRVVRLPGPGTGDTAAAALPPASAPGLPGPVVAGAS